MPVWKERLLHGNLWNDAAQSLMKLWTQLEDAPSLPAAADVEAYLVNLLYIYYLYIKLPHNIARERDLFPFFSFFFLGGGGGGGGRCAQLKNHIPQKQERV